MRSLLVSLGAVGIAVSGVVVAPVANAANALTCPLGAETEALTGDSQSWTIPVGSGCDKLLYSVEGVSTDDLVVTIDGSVVPSFRTVAVGSAVTMTYNGSSTGTVTLDFWWWDNGNRKSTYTVTVGPAPSASPDPSDSSDSSGSSGAASGPAAVVQQFGMPASGTCDEAQPEGLDWAGVASGGWSTAWGEWMHDGLGGWACSRTLSYSSSQGMWVVD